MPADPFAKKFQETDKLLKALDTRVGAIEKLVKTMDARIKVVADSMTSSKDIENYVAVLEKDINKKSAEQENALKKGLEALEKKQEQQQQTVVGRIMGDSQKKIDDLYKEFDKQQMAQEKAVERKMDLAYKAADARDKESQKEQAALEKEMAKVRAENKKYADTAQKEMEKAIKEAKIAEILGRLAAVEGIAKAALAK